MKALEKVVIASRNPAKKERYSRLMLGLAREILELENLGIDGKPTESGETAEQNAEIKAKFYAEKCGFVAFSEDEALYVDFLPPEKQPGVHVRRVEGKDEVDDDALLAYWERIVAQVPEDQRTGKWHTAYCVATPGGKVKMVALDHPVIFFSPSSEIRIPGWPMSSLEGPVKFGKPHSELTDEERQQLEQENNRLVLAKLKELFG